MILARHTVLALRGARPVGRGLSTRASDILTSLGISSTAEVSGVYDGKWGGSGELMQSICPTTGEVLARVKTVSTGYTPLVDL